MTATTACFVVGGVSVLVVLSTCKILDLLVPFRPANPPMDVYPAARDGRKFLRLACGAVVRKLNACDIDQLLRRCLTPNLGGLRKGDVVVFCYHDCVHCNHLTGCDKAFVVRRVAVGAEIDCGRVAVHGTKRDEVYWVSPGVDDADHVPIAIGPVVRAFLLHEKSQMRVVVPPVPDCGDQRDERRRGGYERRGRHDGGAPNAEEV